MPIINACSHGARHKSDRVQTLAQGSQSPGIKRTKKMYFLKKEHFLRAQVSVWRRRVDPGAGWASGIKQMEVRAGEAFCTHVQQIKPVLLHQVREQTQPQCAEQVRQPGQQQTQHSQGGRGGDSEVSEVSEVTSQSPEQEVEHRKNRRRLRDGPCLFYPRQSDGWHGSRGWGGGLEARAMIV